MTKYLLGGNIPDTEIELFSSNYSVRWMVMLLAMIREVIQSPAETSVFEYNILSTNIALLEGTVAVDIFFPQSLSVDKRDEEENE